MFPTLALAAALALAPAQNAALTISNARFTFGGALGATRPNNRFLPGDLLLVAFDIENLTADKKGLVQYVIGMELTDAAGKSIYNYKPELQGAYLLLGGPRLPSNAFKFLDPNLAPGTYKCKITVTDQASKKTKELVETFDLLPAAFGTVGVVASSDEAGALHCPLGGFVGQAVWLHFNVVQFGRDAQTKQPDVTTEITVLEQGKAVNPDPVVIHIGKLPPGSNEMAHSIMLPLNRAGSFTVQIKNECSVTKKTSTTTVPIKVTAPPR